MEPPLRRSVQRRQLLPLLPLALLLLLLLLLLLQPAGVGARMRMPWHEAPPANQVCNKLSSAWYKNNDHFKPITQWLGLTHPLVTTDAFRVKRNIQRMNPTVQMVSDPLPFLKFYEHTHNVTGLPGHLHMTLRDKAIMAPHQIISITSWAKQNRDFHILLYDDQDMLEYVQTYFPAFLPTFQLLRTTVEKSDAWRYLVLCRHGGIYADSDTIAMAPVSAWARYNRSTDLEPALYVGIERFFPTMRDALKKTYVRRVQMIQWIIASKQRHAVMCRMADYIRLHLEGELAGHMGSGTYDAGILQRTGPGIWTDSVTDFLKKQGVHINSVLRGRQVQDVAVLPLEAFGCHARKWKADVDASRLFVYHMYNNSWKKDGTRAAQLRITPVTAVPAAGKKAVGSVPNSLASMSSRFWLLYAAMLSLLGLMLTARLVAVCTRRAGSPSARRRQSMGTVKLQEY